MITPFVEALRDDWLDPYGHMNEGYYSVAFANAGWDFLRQLGIGVAYFEQSGCGWYTAESHIRFLKEVRAPALLETRGIQFACDAKRMHYGFVLKVEGVERATLESVAIHFDTKAGRVTAAADEVVARLRDAQAPVLPSWAGRGVSLERR